MIACVVVRQIAIAIERANHPSLARVPVILAAAEMVYAASEEASSAGVSVGMTLHRARLLCPDAQVIPAHIGDYRAAFGRVIALLSEFTHLLEPASDLWPIKAQKRRKRDAMPAVSDHDHHAVVYLNLENLNADSALYLVNTIIDRIQRKTGLTPTVGLAAGKFPALIAALSTEPGTTLSLSSGVETVFLADKPIDILPLDGETERRLRLFGIETVGQLAQLPVGAVSTQFGKAGTYLYQLSTGRDVRPIIPYKPGAVVRFARHLDGVVQDRLVLEATLRVMAQEMTVRLRMDGRMARRVDFLVRLENSSEARHSLKLRRPTWNPDHLSSTLKDMLTYLALRCGVLAFEVSLSDFVPASGQQLELFPQTGSQDRLLLDNLPDVIARYGAKRFYWLTPAKRQSRLPGNSIEFTPVDSSV